MMDHNTHPGLSELLEELGSAGYRMEKMGASEGGAGNLSVFVGWELEPGDTFPLRSEISLPVEIPELAGKAFLVTGSGQRLGEVHDRPETHVGFVRVLPGGKTAELFRARGCQFTRLTTEFNSHITLHYDQALRTGCDFHAVIHAQPPNLTFLSHIPRYRDAQLLNLHLLRWQPETIVFMPEGLGVVPFGIPGSEQLRAATRPLAQKHRMVVWAQHGVIVRSADSLGKAADLVEYIETSARYEYMDLLSGGQADGLSVEQLRIICKAYNVPQTIFPE